MIKRYLQRKKKENPYSIRIIILYYEKLARSKIRAIFIGIKFREFVDSPDKVIIVMVELLQQGCERGVEHNHLCYPRKFF